VHADNGTSRVRTTRWVLLLVALVALIPRVYVALTTTYVWDEERDWIPLAKTISVTPSDWHTPIRGSYHPALPAYGIALGRFVFGANEIGTRLGGIVFGVATVVVVFLLVRDVGGTMLGAWTAALLLAANEYHVHASVLATEKAYYLFFAAVAVWFFLRFMNEQRPIWLYAAAVATGVSFLCKETGALLLPVFFIALLATRQRVWLARWQPYFAVALFAVVIAPDLWWNVTNQDPGAAADYGRHLSGAFSLGITYQPLVLYGREAVAFVLAKMGRPFYDNGGEYAAGNFLLSLIIVGGVCYAIWNLKSRREPKLILFLVLFAFIFLFFTFFGTRSTPGLDAFGFFWGDLSLLGAVVLGGYWVGQLRGWPRGVALCLFVAGLAFAGQRIFLERLGTPFVSVRPDPQVIEHAPGVFRDVALSFNYCAICDQRPRVELVSVRARRGDEDLPAADSRSLITEAALGTDDRLIRVSAFADPPPTLRNYVLEYRITPRNGKAYTARGRIGVRYERPPRLRDREW
jgi:4-amino-4-deoxy-L-arabinose transferase-like glycosyltransferase